MKYDILEPFRAELARWYSNEGTRDKYFYAVKKMLDMSRIDAVGDMSVEEIKKHLVATKTKNDFSALKNGLKVLKRIEPRLQLPTEKEFQEQSKKKKNRRKRVFAPISKTTIMHKINKIPNQQKKLAFRLMAASGARVSEISALQPEDIQITGNEITVHIQNGKGGKSRNISGITSKYLAERLPELEKQQEKTLFPAAVELQKTAAKYGFECHDLRRMYAQESYASLKRAGLRAAAAKCVVMGNMGHVKWKTTRRYMMRKFTK